MGQTVFDAILRSHLSDDEKLRRIKLILDNFSKFGVDINSPNGFGMTPLLCAVYDLKSIKVIKGLIQLGADISMQVSVSNLVSDNHPIKEKYPPGTDIQQLLEKRLSNGIVSISNRNMYRTNMTQLIKQNTTNALAFINNLLGNNHTNARPNNARPNNARPNNAHGGSNLRKCPKDPAKKFNLSTIKTGSDGKKWYVTKRSTGVKTWTRK